MVAAHLSSSASTQACVAAIEESTLGPSPVSATAGTGASAIVSEICC